MKRSRSFLSGILIIALCFLLGNDSIAATSFPDSSITKTEKETSSFKAVSHTLFSFTEPKDASINYTLNQVVPVIKTLSKVFGGITTETVTVREVSGLQYHNFLRHFPIPFRALDMLFPSHYFW